MSTAAEARRTRRLYSDATDTAPIRIRLSRVDVASDPDLERMARLASRVLRAPVAAACARDEAGAITRQAVRSAEGSSHLEPAAHSLLRHPAVAGGGTLLVLDTAANPLLPGASGLAEAGIGSCLAVPLRDAGGACVGTLVVADPRPRHWGSEQAEALEAIAETLMSASSPPREPGELRESEERSRLLVQSVTDYGIFMLSPRGDVLSWNPGAERIKGYTAEEIVGRHFSTFYAAEDVARDLPAHDLEVAARTGRFEAEGWRLRKDGGRCWAIIVISAIHDGGGDLTGFTVVTRDLTERRRMEEALQESERLFRQVTENIDEVFWLARLDAENGSVMEQLYVSPAADRVFGRDAATLEGSRQARLDMVAPEHRASLAEAWDRVSQGEATRLEFEILLPDGTRRWVGTRMSPIRDEAGRVTRVAGATMDISAQRAAQQELSASHNLLAAVIEGTRDPIFVKDVHGRYLLSNTAAARVLGHDAAAVIGRDDWALVPPEAALRMREHDDEVVSSGTMVTRELPLVTPEGERTYLVAKGPYRDPSGTVIGLIGIARDISAIKREEEVLKMRERQLAEAQRMAFLGSWECDAATGEVTWSDELYTIFGLEPQSEPCTYESYLARVHPGDRDRVRDIVDNAARTGTSFEYEDRIIRPDGTERVLLCRGGAIKDEGGRVVRTLGTCQDITAQREAERSLREAMAQSERASEAKSEFLSRMSHELRTPLNAILGFGQLLEVDPTVEDRESVDHILGAGKHLLTLIDEMLDLSKIEAGKIHLVLEPVKLAETVRQSSDLVRPIAEEHGVTVEIQAAPRQAAFVQADAQRLKQVLLNLLSNAVKYNRPGGSVVVALSATPQNRVRIEVRDTGLGLDAEQISKLFIPFERVGAERTKVQGTGLGLALSRGLVQAMGGQLGIESVPGVGSTFWFELPGAPEAGTSAPEAEEEELTPETGATTRLRRVLYIEDNLLNLRLVERLLGRRGDLELIHAMQGSLGIELARQHLPDLILLDVQLPDINGDEVLWRLQQDPVLRTVPVVAVSADATARQVQRLTDLGARDYLTKPIDVRRFLTLIDEILPVEA